MYDYIKGSIVNKTETQKGRSITIETNNIGYLIDVNLRTFQNYQVNEENKKVYVSLIHKEDSMTLTGFAQKEDRDIFNILQSVSGIGVKVALTLLDEFSGYDLITAVIKEDDKSIARTKGIGPKLAKKIILELKDKLINWQKIAPIDIPDIEDKTVNTELISEVQAVLTSLGYSPEEIKESIRYASKFAEQSQSTEDILKEALSFLANK